MFAADCARATEMNTASRDRLISKTNRGRQGMHRIIDQQGWLAKLIDLNGACHDARGIELTHEVNM